MPTYSQMRSRQGAPVAQLTDDLGATIIALLQYLSERGERESNADLRRQQLILGQQQLQLGQQQLRAGERRLVDEPKQVEQSLRAGEENIQASQVGRREAAAAESIAGRTAEASAEGAELEKITMQARAALDGVPPEAFGLEGGWTYGPAREMQMDLQQRGDTATTREFVGRVYSDVMEQGRRLEARLRREQAEIRKRDPSSAEILDDEAIQQRVADQVEAAFRSLGRGRDGEDLDIRAQMVRLLQLDAEDEPGGLAARLTVDFPPDEEFAQRKPEIRQQREIGRLGGLQKFLESKEGFTPPPDLVQSADTPEERRLLEMIASDKLTGSDALAASELISKGQRALEVVQEGGMLWHRGPGGLRMPITADSPRFDEDVVAEMMRELRHRAEGKRPDRPGASIRGGAPQGDYLRGLLGEPTAPPAPAPAAAAPATPPGSARFGEEGWGGIGGSSAAQDAAFQDGITQGVSLAIAQLTGAPQGPRTPPAPPIPGATRDLGLDALSSFLGGGPQAAAGALTPGAFGPGPPPPAIFPAGPTPQAQQQLDPAMLMLLPLLMGGFRSGRR